MVQYSHRVATLDDVDSISALMNLSIEKLLSPHLTKVELAASYEIMGLDTQLIEDGTYFMVYEGESLVGCGGWGKRKTEFGGNHTVGRNDNFLNPTFDAAKIRAMYTHPSWQRRGVGSYIIRLCETAIMTEEFKSIALVATVAGEQLYKSCGYSTVEEFFVKTSTGVKVPVRRMEKNVS